MLRLDKMTPDVSKLQQTIARLEKEADWLALQVADFHCPHSWKKTKNCTVVKCTVGTSIQCWREAARMAIKDD